MQIDALVSIPDRQVGEHRLEDGNLIKTACVQADRIIQRLLQLAHHPNASDMSTFLLSDSSVLPRVLSPHHKQTEG